MDPRSFRQRTDIQNEENTPWPWYPGIDRPQYGTYTGEALLDKVMPWPRQGDINPIPALGAQLGARDIRKPSDDDMVRFLIDIDRMNSPEGRAEYNAVNGPWLPQDWEQSDPFRGIKATGGK